MKLREVLKAIIYVLKPGCQWDPLAPDFPAKGSVYPYFNPWRKDDPGTRMNEALPEPRRQQRGRAPTPSAGSSDSQSVKTTEKGA